MELQGVMPDIVTMAKGIGNGLPLAAVVTTPQIAEVRRHACKPLLADSLAAGYFSRKTSSSQLISLCSTCL